MPRATTPIVALLAVSVAGPFSGGCGEGTLRDRTVGVWSLDAKKTDLGKEIESRTRLRRLAYGTFLKLRPNGEFFFSGIVTYRGTWAIQPTGDVVLTPGEGERFPLPVTLRRKGESLLVEFPSSPFPGGFPGGFGGAMAAAMSDLPTLVLRKSG